MLYILYICIFFYLMLEIFHIGKKTKIKYNFDAVENKRMPLGRDRIPNNIIQSSSSRYVTEDVKKNIEKWKKLNPDFSYTYFEEREIIDFIKTNYEEKFLGVYYRIKKGRGREDFFRYLYLYKFGGFYVDLETVIEVPVRKFISTEKEVVVVKDKNGDVFNGFIGFSRKHKILENCIENCIEKIQKETFSHFGKYCLFDQTGTEMLKEVLDRHSQTEKISVLDERKKYNFGKNRIYHGSKLIMKPNFPKSKENIEFMNGKSTYDEENLGYKNSSFLDEIVKLENIEVKKNDDKNISFLVNSTGDIVKLRKFFTSAKNNKIIEYVREIIVLDNFTQNDDLISIYKEMSDYGVNIRLNSNEKNKFVTSLNILDKNSIFIFYFDEDPELPDDTVMNVTETYKRLRSESIDNKVIVDMSKYFGFFSVFFHRNSKEKFKKDYLKNGFDGINKTTDDYTKFTVKSF